MRVAAFAALLACPFVACYCTLAFATTGEHETSAYRHEAPKHLAGDGSDGTTQRSAQGCGEQAR